MNPDTIRQVAAYASHDPELVAKLRSMAAYLEGAAGESGEDRLIEDGEAVQIGDYPTSEGHYRLLPEIAGKTGTVTTGMDSCGEYMVEVAGSTYSVHHDHVTVLDEDDE